MLGRLHPIQTAFYSSLCLLPLVAAFALRHKQNTNTKKKTNATGVVRLTAATFDALVQCERSSTPAARLIALRSLRCRLHLGERQRCEASLSLLFCALLSEGEAEATTKPQKCDSDVAVPIGALYSPLHPPALALPSGMASAESGSALASLSFRRCASADANTHSTFIGHA